MKLFDLLESPKLTVDQPVLGVQTAVDQHTPSPIGSGTSKREAKKKKVTMMGVPVVAESGPFSYGAKKPRQGSVADLAAQKRKEQEKNKKPVEPRDHMVGVARVNKDVAESISVVDQDYDLDQMHLILDIEGKKVSFTYWDYEEDFSNAERRDVFDQLQEQPWYKGLDYPTKMEILDAAYRAIRGLEPQEYRPTVGDEPLDEQGVAEGLPQTLRKFVPGYAKREIDKKMDAGKFGRDDVAKDANFYRYKKIQDKIKEQGVAEAETGVVQTAMNKISPVKQWLLTLQKKLGTEASETKTMFDTYLRYTQGKASKQEMAAANEQFKDVVRGLGMGTLAAMPGSVITLPLVFKLAKQFNVELMPSAFRSETPSGVAEGGSGISKDQETKFHKKLDKLVHDTFGKRKGEMEEGTVQDKLYQRHQELRKKSGLPDPNYYKELKATYELPDEQRYKKTAELKKQYGVKEEVTETLGRAIPKMPKPRDPGNKILANKKNAAGKHIDKKQQQKRGIEKHRGLDIKTNLDLDEGWKSALAGAALAGATALGSPAYATEPVQQDITYVATIQTNDGLQKQINLGTNFNNNKEAYEYVDKFLKDRGIGVSFLNVAKVKTKPGEVQAKQPTQNQPQDANKDSNYLDTKPPTWKKGSGDYSEKGPYVATPTDKDYMQKMEEEKKGLYYYVNKRKKAGTSRPKDHPKAPSAQDWKDAAKTAKKNEDVSEDINESMERYLLQLRLAGYDIVQEEKVRLDPKCWKGKKIGKPKTKMKGGVRVNNCVPK